MNQPHQMVSVGIDIGTTTIQVIFSELTLIEITRVGQIPRLDISGCKVLYAGEIVFTPLLDAETIDARRLGEIVRKEYQRAGIKPVQVETGAVIITGETARKKNADEILQAIAGLAGDFVVSIAGPNVEGMIAGRGSGAAAYSRSHFTTITNIDIGGGSANSAVFRQGSLAASAAMNYGGRVIEVDPSTLRVRHITRAGKILLQTMGVSLAPGEIPGLEDLQRVTEQMAELTVHLIEGTTSPLADQVYQTPPSPVSGQGKPVMFSGGIGYYYYNPIPCSTLEEVVLHGDIGPLLAQSLGQNANLNTYRVLQPAETVRATVLGASSQTLILSGSTIWAEANILPLKNVPVVRPDLSSIPLQASPIAGAITNALGRWDLALESDPFAVCLEVMESLDYITLTRLAEGLVEFSQALPAGRPLIAVIQHDYAQALGQTIKGMDARRPLLVIDQVGLKEGDYIDIGAPLMDGRVVPLVVKTLIFYH
jgi:ethanolamine utilization protein EutA